MSEEKLASVVNLGDSLPNVRVPPPGPASRAWASRLEHVESPAFGRRREDRGVRAGGDALPIVYASAKGSNIEDADGNVYVDLAAGFGAMALGHGALPVRRALAEQAEKLFQALGDLHSADTKVLLLEKLAALYPEPGARVLLGQSGSDAVSAALKTAALATGKPGIVAFEGAYHGLGYGPLSALGLAPSWREPFAEQLNPHVDFAPYPGSSEALDASLSRVEARLAQGDVGAILVEPILGRGGIIVPPEGFLRELSALARRASALLVADEIWTGLGRSGSFLASVASGVVPDLVCLGKSLGGGLPISACIGSAGVMEAWRREPSRLVVHTATFHGAPLACATALATLDVLHEDKLDERAAAVGERFRSALSTIPGVQEARGSGLMVGVTFEADSAALSLQRKLLEAGYITTLGGRKSEVLVLTPALTIDERLLQAFASQLHVSLKEQGLS